MKIIFEAKLEMSNMQTFFQYSIDISPVFIIQLNFPSNLSNENAIKRSKMLGHFWKSIFKIADLLLAFGRKNIDGNTKIEKFINESKISSSL